MVGTNGEHLRRVGVGFEVNDGEGVTERVKNRGLVHLMVVRRWMNLHTLNIVIRYVPRVKCAGDPLLPRPACSSQPVCRLFSRQPAPLLRRECGVITPHCHEEPEAALVPGLSHVDLLVRPDAERLFHRPGVGGAKPPVHPGELVEMRHAIADDAPVTVDVGIHVAVDESADHSEHRLAAVEALIASAPPFPSARSPDR